MRATLFTTVLVLASTTVFALPQGAPQKYQGGNTDSSPVSQGQGPPKFSGDHPGGNTDESPVSQGGHGPPPSYGGGAAPGGGVGSPVGGGQPKGAQPQSTSFGNGNGQQPGGGIGSPVGGIPPQGAQPQGSLPGSLQPFPNGQQPGRGIGSPVSGMQPQGAQPQSTNFGNGNGQQPAQGIGSPVGSMQPQGAQPQSTNFGNTNQPQVGGGGHLPQGVPPNQASGSQPGLTGPRPQEFGQYHPHPQGGTGSPNGLGPQSTAFGSQPGLDTASPISGQPPGGMGSPNGPQSTNFGGRQPGPQPANGIGSPEGQGQRGQPNLPHTSGESGIGSLLGGLMGHPPHDDDDGHACGPSGYGSAQCVSQPEAEQFIQRFISILTHTTSDLGDAATTADQIIGEEWVEYSNSILSLQGLPLTADGISAHTKQEWTQGVLHAPAFGGVQTLKVLVACDQVLWYWSFAQIGSGEYPAKGFNLFTLRREGEEVVGSQVAIEFDSIAWGLDTGIQVALRDGRREPEGGAAKMSRPSGRK